MGNSNYGEFNSNIDYGSNYRRLEKEKQQVTVITNPKKKYKAPDAMCVRMPRRFGGKDRLKKIAKQQNKRYHTLAVDYIMRIISDWQLVRMLN